MVMYLVVDDLAIELKQYPIHIPIPNTILENNDDELLRMFTIDVIKNLMSLNYFTWTHHIEDVIIDSFDVRHDKIYPSFST